jgi:hypothetical protein
MHELGVSYIEWMNIQVDEEHSCKYVLTIWTLLYSGQILLTTDAQENYFQSVLKFTLKLQ